MEADRKSCIGREPVVGSVKKDGSEDVIEIQDGNEDRRNRTSFFQSLRDFKPH